MCQRWFPDSKKLLKFGFAFTPDQLITLILGMAVAFVVSVGSIRFLMNYVRRHDFKVFGWYRIVLGALVLLMVIVLSLRVGITLTMHESLTVTARIGPKTLVVYPAPPKKTTAKRK